MTFFNLGLVVMFMVNFNLLPGRLSDLGEDLPSLGLCPHL